MPVTKYSFIQGGRVAQGYLDSGPYLPDEWAWLEEHKMTNLQASYTNGVHIAMQGVIPNIAGNLKVGRIGSNLTVNGGAAYCGGHPYIYKNSLIFVVPTPTTASRTDYLVLLQNNTASAVTVSTAGGHTLSFPSDLSIYESTAAIPPYRCRLALVLGTEGGGVPTLDYDRDDLFMLPLYRYTVSTGAVFSAEYETRRFAISPLGGRQMIEEIWYISGSPGFSYSFQNIPDVFNRLEIVAFLSPNTAVAYTPNITLNGDTGANYDYLTHVGDSTLAPTAQAGLTAAANNIQLGNSQTVSGEYPFYTRIEIPRYQNTATWKVIRAFSSMGHSVGPRLQDVSVTGFWQNTNAINRVDFNINSPTGNFADQTNIRLYGFT